MADSTPRLGRLIVIMAALSMWGGVTLARAQDSSLPVDEALDAGLSSDAELDGQPSDYDAETDLQTDGESLNDTSEAVNLPDDEAWIFVDKSERRMVVNDGNGYRETFRVALGQVPEGDKRREGDGRTPEGEFYVCNRIRHDRFQRFLGVAYPGPADAERGRRHRMLQPIEYRAILRAHRRRAMPPWGTALGGNIGIHGYGRRRDRASAHAAGRDWTDGCIAVTNEEIERIADHIRVGTRVVIVP